MSRDEDSDSIEDNRKFPAKSPKQKEAKHSANFFLPDKISRLTRCTS